MSKKYQKACTPIGESRWAFTVEPKKPFQDKGDPKYEITVVFDPNNQEWAAWGAEIKKLVAEVEGKNNPIHWDMKKDDNGGKHKTGMLAVRFKTGEQFKPSVFDKFNRLMESRIGNGSMVRVNYSPSAYKEFGGGITLYLNAIQVMELVPVSGSTNAADFGFEPSGDPPPAEMQTESDPAVGEPPEQARAEDIDSLPF